MECDLLIDFGTIITMDAERRVLPGGAIAIANDRIVAVLEQGEPRPTAATTINAFDGIVLPGIVDSHGHAGHCLTKGLGEGFSGDGWMDLMRDIYDHASDDAFWIAESRLAALERLTFGVTTSLSMTGSTPRVDDPRYAVAAATGYSELGLRHVVAAGPAIGPWPRQYTDRSTLVPGPADLDIETALRVTEEIIEHFEGSPDGRIRGYVAPSQIMTNPGDVEFSAMLNRRLMEIVARRNTGFHAHAYAGMVASMVEHTPEIFGPHCSLAHCAGIALGEVDILASTETSASSGPLTHAYALARFPLFEALDRGVNVAFSTDGTAPDRSFDLLSQARIGGQLQRVHFSDTSLLPPGKMLAMITIDAARALGMHKEVGSLEAGKKADIAILDANRPHLAPPGFAPLRVIQHASGCDVTTVICDGTVLMEGGVVRGVDIPAILADAQSQLASTLERGGISGADAIPPGFWHGLRYGSA